MMKFLALVSFLEMGGGVVAFLAAPTVIQEIGGLIAFGFGALTMAVVDGVDTFQRLWRNRERAEAAD